MSIVLLKNLLFGSTKPSSWLAGARSPPARRRGSYGATMAPSPRCSGSHESSTQLEEPSDDPDWKLGVERPSADETQDEETANPDLEAQQGASLLSSRLAIKRSPTGRGFDGDSESSSQTRSKHSRIDARIISDAIIGLSDGLTVPFALTAGLSALGDVKVVIFGGLAELTAGAISMGLGGYLGAQSEVYEMSLFSLERNGADFPFLVAVSPTTPPSQKHRI
jgi:hypothetical protein